MTVAEEGSFNAAAEKLSRTQPAITLAVKQLEEFIGLKLLERTTRQVSTTAEGENFIPIAQRLVRDFDTAIYDLRATAERRSGHVSMAIVPSVASNLLPDIIKAFSAEYPGIHLHLDDDSSQGVQRRVERNEVDFGIASLWKPNKLLDFKPLFADKLELICHIDHKLAKQTGPVKIKELENTTFLDTGITKTLRSRASFGDSKFDFPNITTPTGHAQIQSRGFRTAFAGDSRLFKQSDIQASAANPSAGSLPYYSKRLDGLPRRRSDDRDHC